LTDFFDWPLAGLAKLKPSQIVSESSSDPLGEFALVLALVYNDIKDVILLARFISEQSEDGPPSPRLGQIAGLRSHMDRLMASYLYELLYLLRKRKDVLDSAEFKKVLRHVRGEARRQWDELVQTATSSGAASSTLARIRNNGSFHYYQTRDLAGAFRAFFFADPKVPQNEVAFLSVGRRMPETRFYFADAAASRGLSHFALDDTSIGDLLTNLVRDANQGIVAVLGGFISERGGAIPPKGFVPSHGPGTRKRQKRRQKRRGSKR
jgi:hypothetical protein